MDFNVFKLAIAEQFQRMSKTQLFRADVAGDELWATYLASFPEGTNPIYKTRRKYDCSCCRSFIRTVGNVITIENDDVVSLWDIDAKHPAFQAVADAMARTVKQAAIANQFLHYENVAGTDKSFMNTDRGVHTWRHFFVNLPSAAVMSKDRIPTALGVTRAQRDVLAHGLDTITDDAIDTVLDLIAQNTLYRGAEHLATVTAFRKLKDEFALARSDGRDIFVWKRIGATPSNVSKIRSTVIGTLLVDLSEGVDLERAVASFEAKVAPQNYKRPTALVTKAMIESARAKIEELGLSSALQRRYAVIEDITVNNVIYANRNARRSMHADVFDELAAKAPVKPQSLDKVESVPIEKFIADILPRAESVELMIENRHAQNFVSLIAPTNPTALPLFKWDNPFSWSYNGELADSIKERVKRAGGSVEGDLCCRLAWDYEDDLDFYMKEPIGYTIYYGNRRTLSANGGMLDVDANGIDGQRPDPVENIFYANKTRMRDGEYRLLVNNYRRRSNDAGFEVEIEFNGEKHNIVYDKALRSGETVHVAAIHYSRSSGFKIVQSLPTSTITKNVWSIDTQTFRPVNVVMLSPNYWDGRGVGNKHWFFMLEGCRNPGQARGFFNEFLTDELTAHRKVIEMVGSKLRTEESDRQLSGLGFSSTQRNNVLCKVSGKFSRVINLTF
jgi:hypothetical protein